MNGKFWGYVFVPLDEKFVIIEGIVTWKPHFMKVNIKPLVARHEDSVFDYRYSR